MKHHLVFAPRQVQRVGVALGVKTPASKFPKINPLPVLVEHLKPSIDKYAGSILYLTGDSPESFTGHVQFTVTRPIPSAPSEIPPVDWTLHLANVTVLVGSTRSILKNQNFPRGVYLNLTSHSRVIRTMIIQHIGSVGWHIEYQ